MNRIDVSHISDKICKAYATYNTSFLLTETGALYACGDSTYAANGLTSLGSPYQCHKFTQVPISEKVEDVSPGLFFVAVKTVDNKYYVFGYNNFSQVSIIYGFSTCLNDTILFQIYISQMSH